MRVTRALALLTLVPALLVSCSGDDDGTPDAASRPGAPSTGSASEEAPSEDDAPDEAPPETTAEDLEEPFDLDLPRITLLAPPVEGAGEVPSFEWEPVRGARRYQMTVQDAEGTPIWAWQGTETEVNLGGLQGERPRGVPGPVLTDGSRWAVAAFASGEAVAVSGWRPASP
jgi:hypothetical protein